MVDGLGHLLLIGYNRAGGVVLGLAEVLEDGTFVEGWRTVLDIPPPDFNVSSVVGLPNAHAWFSSSPAINQQSVGGSTVIFDAKHARVITTRRSEEVWQAIAVEGDLLYLFNNFDGQSEICSLNNSGQLVAVKAAGRDSDIIHNPDQYVVSTPGAHLGYNYPGHEAHVRVLNRNGFPSTYKVDDMGKVWVNIVPC